MGCVTAKVKGKFGHRRDSGDVANNHPWASKAQQKPWVLGRSRDGIRKEGDERILEIGV